MLRSDQFQNEINRFLSIIQRSGAQRLVEVGAGGCGTGVLFSEAMGKDSIVVAVDLPPEQGGPSVEMEEEAKKGAPGKYVMVRGRSTAYDTLDRVAKELGQLADVIFIDAEHTRAAALAEYVSYGSLVQRHGMIAFHDICCKELWPMWNELRGAVPTNRSIEIIDDVNQEGCGIGIILGRLI